MGASAIKHVEVSFGCKGCITSAWHASMCTSCDICRVSQHERRRAGTDLWVLINITAALCWWVSPGWHKRAASTHHVLASGATWLSWICKPSADADSTLPLSLDRTNENCLLSLLEGFAALGSSRGLAQVVFQHSRTQACMTFYSERQPGISIFAPGRP
jgi:hypothetical protein